LEKNNIPAVTNKKVEDIGKGKHFMPTLYVRRNMDKERLEATLDKGKTFVNTHGKNLWDNSPKWLTTTFAVVFGFALGRINQNFWLITVIIILITLLFILTVQYIKLKSELHSLKSSEETN